MRAECLTHPSHVAQRAVVDQFHRAAQPDVLKMTRARSETSTHQGLFSINDDALRHTLSYLSFQDCASGPGACSRALRKVSASKELTSVRTAGDYVLRPDSSGNGVVHALATAFGTRAWPTRSLDDPGDFAAGTARELRAPPPRLNIVFHRNSEYFDGIDFAEIEAGEEDFKCGLVDRSFRTSTLRVTGYECELQHGSYIEYQLPFQLKVTDFRIGFGDCCAEDFRDWSFRALVDGHWINYSYETESPWADLSDSGRWQNPKFIPEKYYNIDHGHRNVVSSRFQIKFFSERCMHVRSFELFGTVLPGWSPV